MSRCPQSKMFAVGLYPVCDSDRLNRVSRGWGKEDLALSFQIRGRPLPTHGNCPNPTFPLLQKLIGTPKLWNRDPTFCEIRTQYGPPAAKIGTQNNDLWNLARLSLGFFNFFLFFLKNFKNQNQNSAGNYYRQIKLTHCCIHADGIDFLRVNEAKTLKIGTLKVQPTAFDL